MIKILKKVTDRISWASLIFLLLFVFGCSKTENINQEVKRNVNIDSSCPLIPFVAITGKPTKIQIQQFMDDFKNVGIEQFMIYARSGLELEYMGEEWLNVCGYIIEYAAENGMSVWLYDDYNWPSGRCGGQVVSQNSDFAVKKISLWGDYDPMGQKFGNQVVDRKYFWTISSVPLYTDLLNPEAVKTFIELTHEKYYKRFGQYFGTVVKGFFTDEPSAGYAASHHKTEKSLLELPYWAGMEKDYSDFTGRDFKEDVENFMNGTGTTDFWQDYFHLYGEKFIFSYFSQVREWCDKHGVELTGHLMSETPPQNSILASGNLMNAMRHFSLPGIDDISTRTTLDRMQWVTMKEVENAAIITENGASAELFALGPPDMTLGKRRQMIWISALHGIDHYFLAQAPLDARANMEKPLYYMTITPTQPWFEALKELGEDAKKAEVFARKKAIQKIAVRYPQNLTGSTRFLPEKKKPIHNLPQLIRSIISWQWNPRLIAEDDTNFSNYQVVLSLTQKGIVEEKSGKEFESFEELSSWLDKNLERMTTVENGDGKRLEDVLIKNFEDGSVCVVSLLDTPQGEVMLKQAGSKPFSFELSENGVFTCSPMQTIQKIENVLKLPVDELMPYDLTSQNTLRAVFDETGTFEFKLEKNLDGLSLAVRNYGDTVRVKLDGKELPTMDSCRFLPEDFKELYLESGKISLETGKHTLLLETYSHDYPYFPSMFIAGNFGKKHGNVLSKLPETISIENYRGQGLKEYTGSIIFYKKLDIGKSSYLSIETQGLVTEVFMDGKSIGKKAWAPFRWEIPQRYINKKVDLEIKIWTSVGPLFGDYPRKAGKEGSLLKQYAPQ